VMDVEERVVMIRLLPSFMVTIKYSDMI
jgi:hypothetical protein